MWAVLAALAGLGLLASLFMKGLPLHTKLDSRWALRDPRGTPVIRFEMVPVPVVQLDFRGVNLKA